MKLRKGEHIYIYSGASELNCGSGVLKSFLTIPHIGVDTGNNILIDILYPVSKAKEAIRSNTSLLLQFYKLRVQAGKGIMPWSDMVWYVKCYWHIDKGGFITYLSVPRKWLKEQQ